MLVGEFNAEDTETCLSNFLVKLNAKNIYFMSVKNPSCIDLVIANSRMRFQNTITTGIFGFYKMVITILKTAVAKLIPKK